MKIVKATPAQLPFVRDITHATIRAIYPHYYPQGAVEFFLAYHAEDRIARDISDGIVYLLEEGGAFAGAVTLRGCAGRVAAGKGHRSEARLPDHRFVRHPGK